MILLKRFMKKYKFKNERYLREVIIPQIGNEGLDKLNKSSVLIVGAGGIGIPVISYLAASGVGKLIVLENGKLELSNLNRQIIYKTNDLGESKSKLLKKFINSLNPEIEIKTYNKYANYKEILNFSKKADLVIDCSDNFETRFNVNLACIENKKKYIFAAVYRFEGQVAVFNPDKGPCLGCVFKEVDENDYNCSDYGILGPVTGAIGSIVAIEAIKIIIGIPSLENKMCLLDFQNWNTSFIDIIKNPYCVYCNKNYSKNIDRKLYSYSCKKIVVNLGNKNYENVLNIKLSELRKYFSNLSRNIEIFVFCDKGIKSDIAKTILDGMGFKKVYKIDKL